MSRAVAMSIRLRRSRTYIWVTRRAISFLTSSSTSCGSGTPGSAAASSAASATSMQRFRFAEEWAPHGLPIGHRKGAGRDECDTCAMRPENEAMLAPLNMLAYMDTTVCKCYGHSCQHTPIAAEPSSSTLLRSA